MSINQLVQYCMGSYNKDGCCVPCGNDCKCIGEEDCYQCIKYIHAINTIDRKYNCNNIVFNYVIKHIYRYSSEIEILFNQFEFFQRVKNFRIASIGCGPSSELFGIKQFITNHHLSPIFEYIGFDFNLQWNQIQNKIIEIFGDTVQFSNEDIFSYYEQHPGRLPNVLILNYVLSDIVKFNRNGVEDFVTNLLDLFNRMPNSCMIINDISYYERDLFRRESWRALNYMDFIFNTLNDSQEVVYQKYKYYFVPQQGSGLTYGVRHPSKLLTTKIINSAHLFGPFIYCGSCQLFILKHIIE